MKILVWFFPRNLKTRSNSSHNKKLETKEKQTYYSLPKHWIVSKLFDHIMKYYWLAHSTTEPQTTHTSATRLSILFRFARNDRNIPYQFKNKIKWNEFHLILNLGPFRIFRLNSARNVPVSFHMFCSVLERPLNQIELYSI